MSDKLAWHKPLLRLLDARATAQTDMDALHADPNDEGDVPSWEDNGGPSGLGDETHTGFTGRAHRQFDAAS